MRLKRVTDRDLTEAAKNRLVNSQVTVTEDMKALVYANLGRERRFKAMLIEFPDAAQYVRQALSRGESFEELAQAYSVSWVAPSSLGDIGWKTAGVFPFDIDTLAWSADVGDTLGPFDYPLGSYLIIVTGERPYDLQQSREEMDEQLEQKILQPLYMNRQQAVLDSLRQAADPYFPAEGLALLMGKYYFELPPDQASGEFAYLDAQRVKPTFSAAQESVLVVDFKTAPDWTAAEFAERLAWYPMGLWPRGQTEEQLLEVMNMMVRDYLWIKAAKDLGVLDDPKFQKKLASFQVEMRVNFLYYNDILGSAEPSDEEVLAFFEKNREHYKAPPSYKIAVFASSRPDLIKELAGDWKNGMSYQDLRSKYEPLDPKLETVGESPWIYEGDDLRRDNIVAALREGGVSEAIVDPGSAMVIKLIATRPERLFNFDEIQDQVADDAKTVVTNEKLNEFLEKQKENVGVTIHSDALADLAPPPPAEGQ